MSVEMKDSGVPWVSEIPCDWDVKKGKNILHLHKRPVREDDEVVTCFRDGEVVLRSLRRTEGFTMSDKEIGYQGINEGDIVIHGMDGFAGAMGVSKSTGKGSPILVVCSPKYDSNPQYIIYYLRTLAMLDVFVAMATGIRERSCDLRWNKISELEFILPTSEEQSRIANFLDKKCAEIDELITLQEQMIAQLTTYKQAVITETVTKGLDPNVKMKDSGVEWIGEIPEHFGIIALKFLCKINTGDKDSIDREDNGLYPFFVRSPQVERINTYSYDGEAILMAGDGVGAGRVFHHYIGKFDYHQRVYNLHEFSNIFGKFLFYYLSSQFYKLIDAGSAKSTVDSVRLPMLKDFQVVVPALSEQQSIANYLDQKCKEIDELISVKKEKIEKLKAYKKSVIYEYVTGKKQVN